MAIQVIIADDHTIIRDGLRAILETQADIQVVGDAADGREAVQLAARLKPDLVILDISMPVMNGIEAMQEILLQNSRCKVIILSMHATSEYILRAFQAKANGYLLKESAGKEVIDAVRSVYAGQRYLSQKVSDRMIDEFIRMQEQGAVVTPLESLSLREREVLQLVVEGRSSAEIAGQLGLSVKSIETYRSRLMQKLGIDDLPGLVKFAIRQGLISLE